MSVVWEEEDSRIRPCTITDHAGDQCDVDRAGDCEDECVAKLFIHGTSVHLIEDDRRALIRALGGTVAP